MQIFLGADHRGFELKERLKIWLVSQGYEVTDCGNAFYQPDDDYPDFALAVAEAVTRDKDSRGIVVCGSGAGANVMANKVKGIRCSLALNPTEVQQAREDDNLNVLALSANHISEQIAIQMVTAFLTTDFSAEERHLRRLAKIDRYETEKNGVSV